LRIVGVNGSLAQDATGPLGEGRKRFAIPFFDWAGWHHIGVSGKANHRAGSSYARPEIIDIAEAHFVDFETELLQAFN